MITAPLPRAAPSGTGRLSMIIPRYYGITITDLITLPCSLAHEGKKYGNKVRPFNYLRIKEAYQPCYIPMSLP